MIETGSFMIQEDWEGVDRDCSIVVLDKERFGVLASIGPQWIKTQWQGDRLLSVDSEISSSAFKAIFDKLLEWGYQPHRFDVIPNSPKQLRYRIVRTFEESELSAAPYLNVHLGRVFTDDVMRAPDGKLLASAKTWKNRTAKVGLLASSQLYAVSEKGREELVKSGVKVEFKPVYDLQNPTEVIPGYFVLDSTVRMPPLKDIMITNVKNETYDGEPKKGWFLRDGFYDGVQLHFARADVEAMQKFDLAFLQEAVESRVCRLCAVLLFSYLPVSRGRSKLAIAMQTFSVKYFAS